MILFLKAIDKVIEYNWLKASLWVTSVYVALGVMEALIDSAFSVKYDKSLSQSVLLSTGAQGWSGFTSRSTILNKNMGVMVDRDHAGNILGSGTLHHVIV